MSTGGLVSGFLDSAQKLTLLLKEEVKGSGGALPVDLFLSSSYRCDNSSKLPFISSYSSRMESLSLLICIVCCSRFLGGYSALTNVSYFLINELTNYLIY